MEWTWLKHLYCRLILRLASVERTLLLGLGCLALAPVPLLCTASAAGAAFASKTRGTVEDNNSPCCKLAIWLIADPIIPHVVIFAPLVS